MDENCPGVLIFCLFVQKMEAKLDPITDIFRTMHVTAFGLHRLEATAPWGVIQEKQTEEKVTPSDKRMSPTDLAHFAMLSRGSCWLSVKGIPEPIPLTGGDCFLLTKGTSIVLREQPANTSEVELPGTHGLSAPTAMIAKEAGVSNGSVTE